MNKKAYIDRKNSELVTLGFDPEMAREQMGKLGLKSWGWVDDKGDRAIPDSWEEIELDLSINH